jgi:hypothetical protein
MPEGMVAVRDGMFVHYRPIEQPRPQPALSEDLQEIVDAVPPHILASFRPNSPGIQYLNQLAVHPEVLDALPLAPAEFRPMTDKQREAATQFIGRSMQVDPTGFHSFHGEFGQAFKNGSDVFGFPIVEPSHPIRYGEGGSMGYRPGDKHAPGAFTDVHSHPASLGTTGLINVPSVIDQRAARLMRHTNPDYNYALVQGADLKFYSYNGKLPLRHYELLDCGPGFATPPRSNSPDIVPQLPDHPVPSSYSSLANWDGSLDRA